MSCDLGGIFFRIYTFHLYIEKNFESKGERKEKKKKKERKERKRKKEEGRKMEEVYGRNGRKPDRSEEEGEEKEGERRGEGGTKQVKIHMNSRVTKYCE